jgi:N-acetylglucosamine-6-sulfatase
LRSVDIAATALAGGRRSPASFSRQALWSKSHRDAVLIEYFSDTVFPHIHKMGYYAVRTDRWKYVHYREREGTDELYDLRKDPFELDNRIADNKAPLGRLRAHLTRLLAETGA